MLNSCSSLLSLVMVFLSPLSGFGPQVIAEQRPNILFVTVDDMNCDSVGVFGCSLPNTTPAIDAFAESSLKFLHAHVQVGNCMPSRNVMFSGLFPHTNRVEGFYQIKDPHYPVLCQLMQQAGYYTAIRGKATHSTPYHPFPWDAELIAEDGSKFAPKDVASYYTSTKAGIAASRKANKPFFLSINISDPHKPFWGQGAETDRPSRVFTATEVPVPGYLVDTPAVRDELALYYSTVRRADDCFGNVMRALNESGLQDQTIVIFLSDHGMPLPFAKTQLYHHSTHTPFLLRWPGVTMPGSTNRSEMISCIDVLPTLLDVIGEESPDHLQGSSFLPLLHGHSQPQREFVFKEYNQNSGGACHPIRAVQSKRYLYLWNPWSDGQRIFRSATQGTVTYKQMQQLAKTDPAVAARLQ
ncbi:MAG: sulfatase, partial [Planctomycetaceae bacterium]